MTFETIRLILILIRINTEINIYDFKVILYSLDPLHISKIMLYKDIPDCFNCKVHAFDIDLDRKIIFIN